LILTALVTGPRVRITVQTRSVVVPVAGTKLDRFGMKIDKIE
jgi:hypothetical protein